MRIGPNQFILTLQGVMHQYLSKMVLVGLLCESNEGKSINYESLIDISSRLCESKFSSSFIGLTLWCV